MITNEGSADSTLIPIVSFGASVVGSFWVNTFLVIVPPVVVPGCVGNSKMDDPVGLPGRPPSVLEAARKEEGCCGVTIGWRSNGRSTCCGVQGDEGDRRRKEYETQTSTPEFTRLVRLSIE